MAEECIFKRGGRGGRNWKGIKENRKEAGWNRLLKNIKKKIFSWLDFFYNSLKWSFFFLYFIDQDRIDHWACAWDMYLRRFCMHWRQLADNNPKWMMQDTSIHSFYYWNKFLKPPEIFLKTHVALKENSASRKLPAKVLMPNPSLLFIPEMQFHRIGLHKISNFIGKLAQITHWEMCFSRLSFLLSAYC